ncbi:MAG TPA: hypothetical protein DG942_06200 [Ruminococcaceae bacterium]|jgi:hypothetical protein|nr:hypothetical protein [Oscillospiraceae bacterium]
MHNSKVKKYAVYLPFIVAFILFLFLYSYSFPQGDDFTFTVYGGTLQKIWKYYVYYYHYAGSRMANLFASLLLLDGLSIWKILTPVVTQCTALTLFYCVTGRLTVQEKRWKRDFALACVCAFFPGLIPISYHLFADTFMWMDGSCNYLYSMFFFLLGFIPFWNVLQNRPLPRVLKWVCPFFFVLAGLMHEQVATALFVFCAVSLIMLHKDGKISKYLWALTAASTAIMVFTYTCPGAYYRLHHIKHNANTNLIHTLGWNFATYFSQFNNGLWPIASVLGICAVCFIHSHYGKFTSFIKFFIAFGAVMAPLSQVLAFPKLDMDSSHSKIRTALLLLYWILYFIAIVIAFLIPLRKKPQGRFAAALVLSMGASQLIPAAVGSMGRPLLPLAVMTLLLALRMMENAETEAVSHIQLSAAAVAAFSLLYMFSPISLNYASYCKIEKQAANASALNAGTVNFDQKAFDSRYCYFNSFSSAYHYELRQYYKLGKDVKLDFSHCPYKAKPGAKAKKPVLPAKTLTK